jgi:hypothetical protein
MFRTNLPCKPVEPFRGQLVVTMRPLTPAQAIEAVVISSRYPQPFFRVWPSVRPAFSPQLSVPPGAVRYNEPFYFLFP